MNNPLVSIIVPVYNVQNSVARCLESICAQTWKDIEVILVNDGSRDESFSICEQFREKDPRIVLVDKSNSGVSETRNCGMSLARGKYVQFVDSDDYLDPDFTERLVTAAEANNADLVIAPYWMVIPANSSKATQALENLQENLGIDAEKKPDDIREYGFLPEGIYDRDTFALRLMEKPASFFFSSPARCAGPKTWFSIWNTFCTPMFSYPFPKRATTMCRTPRASATPRSIWLPSCRTNCRCSAITRSCTQSWACTIRCSRSCINS